MTAPRFLVLGPLLAVLGLPIAGCATATSQESPVRSLARATGLATEQGPVKDFVRDSRPQGPGEYIPIGRQSPPRATPVRDAAGVQAMEAELDRAGARARAFANRRAPASTPIPRRRNGVGPVPAGPAPESFPVSPARLRGMRGNAN
jgi:hypothetical protein